MIKHIIFDLDGVLFGDISGGNDYHDILFINAVNTVNPSLNLTKEYHDTNLQGMTSKNKLKIMSVSEDESRKIIALKKELARVFIVENIVPTAEQKEMCKKLVNLNYNLYCVSNSDRSIIEMCLNGLEIMNYFSGIIGKEDVIENKPNPEPYLKAYSTFNLDAKECLIIEDSVSGIESARASGGNVLEVLGVRDISLEKILKSIPL